MDAKRMALLLQNYHMQLGNSGGMRAASPGVQEGVWPDQMLLQFGGYEAAQKGASVGGSSQPMQRMGSRLLMEDPCLADVPAEILAGGFLGDDGLLQLLCSQDLGSVADLTSGGLERPGYNAPDVLETYLPSLPPTSTPPRTQRLPADPPQPSVAAATNGLQPVLVRQPFASGATTPPLGFQSSHESARSQWSPYLASASPIGGTSNREGHTQAAVGQQYNGQPVTAPQAPALGNGLYLPSVGLQAPKQAHPTSGQAEYEADSPRGFSVHVPPSPPSGTGSCGPTVDYPTIVFANTQAVVPSSTATGPLRVKLEVASAEEAHLQAVELGTRCSELGSGSGGEEGPTSPSGGGSSSGAGAGVKPELSAGSSSRLQTQRTRPPRAAALKRLKDDSLETKSSGRPQRVGVRKAATASKKSSEPEDLEKIKAERHERKKLLNRLRQRRFRAQQREAIAKYKNQMMHLNERLEELEHRKTDGSSADEAATAARPAATPPRLVRRVPAGVPGTGAAIPGAVAGAVFDSAGAGRAMMVPAGREQSAVPVQAQMAVTLLRPPSIGYRPCDLHPMAGPVSDPGLADAFTQMLTCLYERPIRLTVDECLNLSEARFAGIYQDFQRAVQRCTMSGLARDESSPVAQYLRRLLWLTRAVGYQVAFRGDWLQSTWRHKLRAELPGVNDDPLVWHSVVRNALDTASLSVEQKRTLLARRGTYFGRRRAILQRHNTAKEALQRYRTLGMAQQVLEANNELQQTVTEEKHAYGEFICGVSWNVLSVEQEAHLMTQMYSWWPAALEICNTLAADVGEPLPN